MGAFFMPFGFVPFASSLLAGGCGACSSRTMSFPALAAATDGSAKRRRAVSQTEGRDWWPPCFTVRYGDRFGTFAFVGVVSCRLGEIRHLGRHPFRMFADTSSGRDKEMLSQSRCPKCGAAGSPAADRCGSLCRSWRVEFPLGKETGKAKGEGLGRLSPCFWSMDGRLLGRNGFRRDGRAGVIDHKPGLVPFPRFPQARACLPREQGPQPPRPG